MMKKIISLFISVFIFSCDDGGGGSSSGTNCDICPNGALGIELQNYLDGNTTCEDAYTSLGCLNVIDFLPLSGVHFGEGADTYDDSLYILFNTDYNITGFQFNIDGLDVTQITNIPAGFEVAHSSNTIIGYSTSGAVVPTGCGILFTINHTESDFEYWNYSNFISNLVFTDDDFSNYDPNTGAYSPNVIQTCFNVTDDL